MSTETASSKIVLDCDPGHDDAIALLLAAGDPRIDLLAVTTVAGNQTLEKVTRNALAVATIAGIHVPIAAGADRPLVRPQTVAPDIHGESGLDGPVLPEPAVALDSRHGVQLLVEFNIIADPEAAQAVFAAPWDVTMVGLDLTHQATADAAVVERIAAIGSPLARFVVDVLAFFASTYSQHQGFDAPPVHDPCCVAMVADPAVLETRDAFVAVELTGTWTTGMTVTDFGDAYGRPHNTHVATRLDHGRFWDMTVAAIAALSRQGAA